MSLLDPKSAAGIGSPFRPEGLDAGGSDPASVPGTNQKDQIEPQEMLLLREFFLLLDEWDRQRNL
jgi:hypothetical protein